MRERKNVFFTGNAGERWEKEGLRRGREGHGCFSGMQVCIEKGRGFQCMSMDPGNGMGAAGRAFQCMSVDPGDGMDAAG